MKLGRMPNNGARKIAISVARDNIRRSQKIINGDEEVAMILRQANEGYRADLPKLEQEILVEKAKIALGEATIKRNNPSIWFGLNPFRRRAAKMEEDHAYKAFMETHENSPDYDR